MAILIGITIPVRLERRQWAIEAATNAPGYTLARAMLEYRELHGTPPLDNDKVAAELRTLPDPDGSIADALGFFDSNGYQVGTVLAAASTKSKSLVPRPGKRNPQREYDCRPDDGSWRFLHQL